MKSKLFDLNKLVDLSQEQMIGHPIYSFTRVHAMADSLLFIRCGAAAYWTIIRLQNIKSNTFLGHEEKRKLAEKMKWMEHETKKFLQLENTLR